MTDRPTHNDGIAAAESIAVRHGLTIKDLRPYAAERLSFGWPKDEGMGSSDVSCHLSFLGNYEPEALTAEAVRLRDRNALVRRVMDSTGNGFDETLALMQRMFEPA